MTARRQAGISHTATSSKNPYGHYSGKVIAVNPEDSTVDIRMYSGDTLRRVRVLFNSANTVAGWRYLTSIQNVNPQATSRGTHDTALMSNQADTIAIVVYLDGNTRTPRVVGFDLPLNAQMHVNEQGLMLSRHESGVYELIDKNGHHETHYPDGSYVIFATDNASKDMTKLKGNGQAWSIPTAPKRRMTVHLAEGIDIDTDGTGNFTLNASGTVTIKGSSVQINNQTF